MSSRLTTNRSPAPWRWAVGGALLGLLLTVVLAAPARWLAAGVQKTTHGMVQLADAQGSLWSGSAVLILSGGTGSRDRTALPGRFHWRIAPSLHGLRIRMAAHCCTPDGALEMHLRPRWLGADMTFADHDSQWPASLLAGLGTPLNTVDLEGQLTLRLRTLALQTGPYGTSMQGEMQLEGHNLSSRLSTIRPLGSYRMTLHGGSSLSMELTTLRGSLELNGSGTASGGRVRFSGVAQAAPGMEAQLANLLNILGQRRGNQAIISLG